MTEVGKCGVYIQRSELPADGAAGAGPRAGQGGRAGQREGPQQDRQGGPPHHGIEIKGKSGGHAL